MAMTIEELIQLLAQHPPDLRVVVNGYEDGFDDPDGLPGDAEVVEALVLRRTSN